MAEPTKKSEVINKLVSQFAGRSREITIKGNRCMMCGGLAESFRDQLSAKEYRISGMCQECQDMVWKGGR